MQTMHRGTSAKTLRLSALGTPYGTRLRIVERKEKLRTRSIRRNRHKPPTLYTLREAFSDAGGLNQV
jgi:hypothetical protein